MLRHWCKNFLFILMVFGAPPLLSLEVASLYTAPNCVRIIRQFPSKNADVWRLDNADKDEGYIQFSYARSHPAFPRYHIWVNSYKGVRDRSQPGVGRALLRWVRSQHPEVVIGGLMAAKNYQRLVEALLAKPFNPDLMRVPFVAALGENFGLHPEFKIENGRILLEAPTIFSYPGRSIEPHWLNRQFLLENPQYWRWVEQELRISED